MVTPYPLLLFGGELKVRQCPCRANAPPHVPAFKRSRRRPDHLPRQVRHAEQTITIDGWMEFEAPPRVAVLFRQLRVELDKLLLAKIAAPTAEADLTGRTVGAIVQLLQEEEGFYVAQGH
jgi:hypothetical protein